MPGEKSRLEEPSPVGKRLTRCGTSLELTGPFRYWEHMRGRKKSDEMRTAILNCAAEAFSRRKFHEVLTDDIALKLGIGKGTLYRYFDSKDDLYFATIVRGLDGMHEALTAVVERAAPMEQTRNGGEES